MLGVKLGGGGMNDDVPRTTNSPRTPIPQVCFRAFIPKISFHLLSILLLPLGAGPTDPEVERHVRRPLHIVDGDLVVPLREERRVRNATHEEVRTCAAGIKDTQLLISLVITSNENIELGWFRERVFQK